MATALTQKEADIQMMLAADVHLGTKNCDFQMERYVFKRRTDDSWIVDMSLISQNVLPRKLPEYAETDSDDGSKQTEDLLEENPLRRLSGKKKRKHGEGMSDAEKEKEMNERDEVRKLENFLFGSLYSPIEFGKEDKDGEVVNGGSFYFDRASDEAGSLISNYVEFQDEKCGKAGSDRKAAWVDEEEENLSIDIEKANRLRKLRQEADERMVSGVEYSSRLRAQHAKLNPGTEWAQLGVKSVTSMVDDSDDDEEKADIAHGLDDMAEYNDLLASDSGVILQHGSKLLPGVLEYSRLVDANVQEHSNGPITSVQFHRNAQLLLAAGLDRRLRFFQIDGKRNPKIQSIFLEDCPIRKAAFLPDGSQVIAGGRRKFFYCMDLVKAQVDKIGPLTGREEKSLEAFEISPDSSTIAFMGNEGYILLVSTKTKELIGTLKMNGTLRSLAFADNGQQLLSSGGDGHVYHWDLRTRRCFHKAVDEGCIEGSALCTSHDGTYFAAGSRSGVVNVYNRDEFLVGKRKPLKTIENLVTKIDGLTFNHDAQILAITSSMKKNSLKLVHVPSFSVFSNWPPQKYSLKYPRCLDFSPGGGFMAVGNAAGKVYLYKLHHYPQS